MKLKLPTVASYLTTVGNYRIAALNFSSRSASRFGSGRSLARRPRRRNRERHNARPCRWLVACCTRNLGLDAIVQPRRHGRARQPRVFWWRRISWSGVALRAMSRGS